MTKPADENPRTVLLTGATGYIGGRLLPLLIDSGYRVRCLTRRPEALDDHHGRIEIVQADLIDAQTMTEALKDVDTAFYLVHSMGAKNDFEKQDRKAAQNFAQAAANSGVRRIIYLGGLGCESESLSKHLRSRHETGEILRSTGVQVIELRTSIVIGSGSLSFEMIRTLVERLPVMVCPKWVRVMAQPIAVEDALAYLKESIEVDLAGSQVFEIGGPDQVSYGEIMREYALQRGLRRWMIPVPVLTPYLSSLWLGLVTPLYARVGRKLIDSLKNPTIVNDRQADEVFTVNPRPLREAISRALIKEDREFAETRWSDALSSSGQNRQWGGVKLGTRLVDSRTIEVNSGVEKTFRPIQRIGGDTGWYYANWLWRLRGFIDLLVGGVGIRRGRRHPSEIRVGDSLDFWRVEAFEPGRRLRLQAEMKVPGRAWLEFEVTGDDQASEIHQTAIFDPAGLFGLVYWYALYPLHQIIFAGMLRRLALCNR